MPDAVVRDIVDVAGNFLDVDRNAGLLVVSGEGPSWQIRGARRSEPGFITTKAVLSARPFGKGKSARLRILFCFSNVPTVGLRLSARERKNGVAMDSPSHQYTSQRFVHLHSR